MINNSISEANKNFYREFLLNVKNLPSVPVVLIEVSKMLDNPLSSATSLAKIISKDQGLTAKLLTVANSPLYGLPKRVSTIEFAIVILGFDHVKNIIIALTMIEAFKSRSEKKWDRKKYWDHSLLTAVAAKKIADDLGYHKSGEAFTAGLLHDLGISVIQRYFNLEYNMICSLVENNQMSYLEAEFKILGMTHQEIGKLLSERWNLPESLSDVIANHHNPSKSLQNPVLASIIHLTDYMTQMNDAGNFLWDTGMPLDEGIIEILKLGDMEYLESFMNSYTEVLTNQWNSSFNI